MATVAPGTLVGPYRIAHLLGTGGMGEVHRARDERLGRDVAIKFLPPSYVADPDCLRRFEQEARTAAALNHPNILAVHDIGTHEGAPYLVSELLQGQTLRDMLGQGPLVTRQAVEYAIAVATGLAAAHDRGIIHRDIKPDNVFITHDGRAKILDFGLAKLSQPLAGGSDSTQIADRADTQGMILGTAGYMSPEQVRGQPLDHRSDIFSFGATLYEMVSGRRAFEGDSVVETLSAILKHDPPVLSAANAAIAAPLATVVRHCLEKERDQRFQSARDLAFALGQLAGASTSAVVAPPAAPGLGRRRWVVGSAAAVATLVAVGSWATLRRPAEVAPPPTFQQLTFRRGHVVMARFAPDGQTVISSATRDGNPLELLSTRLDSEESVVLPLAGAFLRSVSRSGELAVIVKDDLLARVPIGGGGTRELVDQAADADWAPDGSLAVARWQMPHRAWVEYPIGTVIYDRPHAINVIRVAPDGAFVAVVEQERFGGGLEWLTIIDRNGAVVSSSQKWGAVVGDSLAWMPGGGEVWFTASAAGERRAAVHGMTRDGRERIVHRGMGSVRILDLAADGRALLANDSFRADMSLVDVHTPGERDLTWRDWSRPFALSDDGKTLAFSGVGRSDSSGRVFGYVRPTDGSPAVLLSETGNPSAFSPDGKWVLTTSPSSTGWTLVPTGVGQARQVERGRIVGNGASNGVRWLSDGERIVFIGNEAEKPRRLFIQNVAAGPPEALTPEGAGGPFVVSPDSTLVVVRDPKGQLSKYPISRGVPTVLAGALDGDQPLAWSPDGGSIWVLSRTTMPAKIFRIELRTGRRTLWRDVPFPDPATIEPETLRVVMSADGSKFVYGYQKHLSDLYVAGGLR